MGTLRQELAKVMGQLQLKQEDTYRLSPSPTGHSIQTGRIEMLARGDALCVVERVENRVLIPSHQLSGAMQDDTVQVRVRYRNNGKSIGKVVRILGRAHPKLVGQARFSRGGSFAVPVSHKIRNRIKLLDSIEIREGHYVWVEVLDSSDNGYPLGIVREIMGSPLTPRIDEKLIVYGQQLPHRFSQGALEEASRISSFIPDEEVQRRTDLRPETMFTIDGQSSRDLDDAVSIKLLEDGHYLLGVHIADVSHYVKEGSHLDKEARERGMSVYFGDQTVIPMLPARVSEDVCSLIPHQDRLTLSCTIEFDHSGTPVETEIFRSVIHSQARLTYAQVDRMLAVETADGIVESQQIYEDLEIMAQLAETLRRKRLEEGSLDLNLPKPETVFGGNEDVADIVESTQGLARQIIEEFMLATDRAIAEYLHDLSCVFRAQDAPGDADIQSLKEFLEARGYLWNSNGRIDTKVLSDVLSQAQERGEEQIIKQLLCSTNTRAYYSSEPKAHFNLAFEHYTHFTSPIRRYVDLCVHRLVEATLDEDIEQIISMDDKLESIAAEMTSKQERVEYAERTFNRWKQAEFISKKERETFEGYINNTTNYGFFVTFHDFPVTGLVHRSVLTDDKYVYDPTSRVWIGKSSNRKFALGQTVNVRARVDESRRQLSLALAA